MKKWLWALKYTSALKLIYVYIVLFDWVFPFFEKRQIKKKKNRFRNCYFKARKVYLLNITGKYWIWIKNCLKYSWQLTEVVFPFETDYSTKSYTSSRPNDVLEAFSTKTPTPPLLLKSLTEGRRTISRETSLWRNCFGTK